MWLERFFKKKMIAAVLLMVGLSLFSVATMIRTFPEIIHSVRDSQFMKTSDRISDVNLRINENVVFREGFINLFGYLQVLMDKNEENNFEVVKDTDGRQHFTFFTSEPSPSEEFVKRMAKFQREVEDEKTSLLYIMSPDKAIAGKTEFPTGIPYSYANETADEFLAGLAKKGVAYLDLRETLLDSGIAYDELFYQADHHWTTETAFWAFQQVVAAMEEDSGMALDAEHLYTDRDNYNTLFYPQAFVGSMARKAGIYYGGTDDFTFIWPKFKTDYEYSFSDRSDLMENGPWPGEFGHVLMYADAFVDKKDLSIAGDLSGIYLWGNHAMAQVVNKKNVDGPKVLFYKDSMMLPVAAFTSTVCSEVYLLDPRYYKGDIVAFAKQMDFDYIFMSLSPASLTDEFFPFYRE
ncbi:hypothetical protein LQZ18_02060 [Lachnospiraceae bacterium ZAX-1]